MSSKRGGSPLVDQARQVLCSAIARCLREKKFSVRVRVTEVGGELAEGWFYSHDEKGWQKEPQTISDRPLVGALNETLEMLASKGHHDAWSARRHSHSDGHDTDLQFHADKLAGRIDDKLESLLMGILFRDEHDSNKDVRRQIRTPRPARGRK